MMQITKWLSPDQKPYGKKYTLRQWCEQECRDIERRTGRKCIIREEAGGRIAVFKLREKKGSNNE